MKRVVDGTVSQLWIELLKEADLCADYAQEAANCGRFCAACGLIMTADALCERALANGATCGQRVEIESAVASRRGFYQDEVEKLVECAVLRRLKSGGKQ